MTAATWDVRIQRANELASSRGFAAEGLRFYARLARFQKSLYQEIEAASGSLRVPREPGSLRRRFDSFLLLPRLVPFLSLMQDIAPSPLAESSRQLASQGSDRWLSVLSRFWEVGIGSPSDLEPAEALLAWTFLQPYAEYLVDHASWTRPVGTPSECPLCGGKPQVGALRPEGDGGKRSLICALCALEWEYRRVVCPSCGEEDSGKLAVYTTDGLDHVRVETCDTCRTYLKTADLTKDGRAVPVVDELATIPLDLWAAEHGYSKLQSNILGI
jgi:FdhE protein